MNNETDDGTRERMMDACREMSPLAQELIHEICEFGEIHNLSSDDLAEVVKEVTVLFSRIVLGRFREAPSSDQS